MNKQLNTKISNIRNIFDLNQLVLDHSSNFNYINLSTCFQQYGRFYSINNKIDDSIFITLIELTIKYLDDFKIKQLITILNSMGKYSYVLKDILKNNEFDYSNLTSSINDWNYELYNSLIHRCGEKKAQLNDIESIIALYAIINIYAYTQVENLVFIQWLLHRVNQINIEYISNNNQALIMINYCYYRIYKSNNTNLRLCVDNLSKFVLYSYKNIHMFTNQELTLMFKYITVINSVLSLPTNDIKNILNEINKRYFKLSLRDICKILSVNIIYTNETLINKILRDITINCSKIRIDYLVDIIKSCYIHDHYNYALITQAIYCFDNNWNDIKLLSFDKSTNLLKFSVTFIPRYQRHVKFFNDKNLGKLINSLIKDLIHLIFDKLYNLSYNNKSVNCYSLCRFIYSLGKYNDKISSNEYNFLMKLMKHDINNNSRLMNEKTRKYLIEAQLGLKLMNIKSPIIDDFIHQMKR